MVSYLLAAVLPGENFMLDIHSIVFGKSSPSRRVRTTFYGNMRNFYLDGRYLFDELTPHVTVAPVTVTPDTRRWRDFDGYSWIMYDLELMPASYLRRNRHEEFDLMFRTDRPDGLIWFTGNQRNNMHLSLKVRVVSLSFY